MLYYFNATLYNRNHPFPAARIAKQVKLLKLCLQWYDNLLTRLVPAGVDRDSAQADSAANLLNLNLLSFPLILCFVAEFAWFGLWQLAGSLMLAGMVMMASPWIYQRTGSMAVARESFLISLYLFKLWESVFLSSVISPGAMWYVMLPAMGILLGSIRSGLAWLVVSTGSILLQSFLGSPVTFAGSPAPEPAFLYTFSLVFVGFSLAAFILLIDTSRKKAIRRLIEANRTIRELAVRDPLTGIFNRRYIWERMEGEERRALSASTSFYICLIDLDSFKQVNDTLGHAAGDIVLQAVARVIESQVRDEDCFGRYGGEEFILVLRGRDTLDPARFAERIRRSVAELRFAEVPDLQKVTVSIGVARFEPGEGFGKTISRADTALYAAKQAGRDQVVFAGGSVQTTVGKDELLA